jgi:hypothetical protein
MANYECTTVYYHGSAEDVIAEVETYLDSIDSTTAILFAPVIFVGGVSWVTAFIVHTDDT